MSSFVDFEAPITTLFRLEERGRQIADHIGVAHDEIPELNNAIYDLCQRARQARPITNALPYESNARRCIQLTIRSWTSERDTLLDVLQDSFKSFGDENAIIPNIFSYLQDILERSRPEFLSPAAQLAVLLETIQSIHAGRNVLMTLEKLRELTSTENENVLTSIVKGAFSLDDIVAFQQQHSFLNSTETWDMHVRHVMIGAESILETMRNDGHRVRELVSLIEKVNQEIQRGNGDNVCRDITNIFQHSNAFLDIIKMAALPLIMDGAILIRPLEIKACPKVMSNTVDVSIKNIQLQMKTSRNPSTLYVVGPSPLGVAAKTERRRLRTRNENTRTSVSENITTCSPQLETNSNSASSTPPSPRIAAVVDNDERESRLLIRLNDIREILFKGCRWSARQRGWPHVEDHGNMDGTLHDIAVALAVRIVPLPGSAPHGIPVKVQLISSRVIIGRISVSLYNCKHHVIAKMLTNVFSRLLQTHFSNEIGKALERQRDDLEHVVNRALELLFSLHAAANEGKIQLGPSPLPSPAVVEREDEEEIRHDGPMRDIEGKPPSDLDAISTAATMGSTSSSSSSSKSFDIVSTSATIGSPSPHDSCTVGRMGGSSTFSSPYSQFPASSSTLSSFKEEEDHRQSQSDHLPDNLDHVSQHHANNEDVAKASSDHQDPQSSLASTMEHKNTAEVEHSMLNVRQSA